MPSVQCSETGDVLAEVVSWRYIIITQFKWSNKPITGTRDCQRDGLYCLITLDYCCASLLTLCIRLEFSMSPAGIYSLLNSLAVEHK